MLTDVRLSVAINKLIQVGNRLSSISSDTSNTGLKSLQALFNKIFRVFEYLLLIKYNKIYSYILIVFKKNYKNL